MGRYDPPRELIDRLREAARRKEPGAKKALKQVQEFSRGVGEASLRGGIPTEDLGAIYEDISEGRLDSDMAMSYLRGEIPEDLSTLMRGRLPVDEDEADRIITKAEAEAPAPTTEIPSTAVEGDPLKALGWTDEEIAKMSPDMKQVIVQRGITPEATAEPPPSNPKPKKAAKKVVKEPTVIPPPSETKLDQEAKKILNEAGQGREGSGRSVNVGKATGLEGQSKTGESFDRGLAVTPETPEDMAIAAEEDALLQGVKADARDEYLEAMQRKLSPLIGPEDAARLTSLEDVVRVAAMAESSTTSTAVKGSMKSLREYLQTNMDRIGGPDFKIPPEAFAATAIGGHLSQDAKNPRALVFKGAIPAVLGEVQVDPQAVAQLKQQAVAPSPAQVQSGNVKQPPTKGPRFAVPANLEEALAAESLDNEQWRRMNEQRNTTTASQPPNARGSVEDARGLGRNPRKPLQYPPAVIGPSQEIKPTPPMARKIAPENLPKPKAPPGGLQSVMAMIKDLVKAEGEAASSTFKQVARNPLGSGGTLLKWAGGTGLGGILSSMLIGTAGDATTTVMRANAASEMVPSVGDIINRVRLQQMQEEKARNALSANPELMKQLRQQLEGRKMMASGQLPGEISIGGDPTNGPFQDPEGLVTRLAAGL